MVVLTAISLFCRKWLHKEDYPFKRQMNLLSSMGTEHLLSSSPSEYWLLGFKDRELEDEYLNDLVLVSKDRIYLGYGMCALIVFLDIPWTIFIFITFPDPQYYVFGFILYCIMFAIFIAGLISR